VSCALLLIMKYIPGLHLRVSDDAEEKGLDLDQFFDEDIGDWGIFDEFEKRRMMQDVGMIMGQTPRAESGGESSDRVEETKAHAA
jgi:ammonium transporter, Amt family